MGMTMTQKILARAAGLESVTAGQLILANLSLVLGNDITSPVAIREYNKLGGDVFDKEKIAELALSIQEHGLVQLQKMALRVSRIHI